MKLEEAKLKFEISKPILKEELRSYFKEVSDNTFNQELSYLVKYDVIRRYENGIYYFPHHDLHFNELKIFQLK